MDRRRFLALGPAAEAATVRRKGRGHPRHHGRQLPARAGASAGL